MLAKIHEHILVHENRSAKATFARREGNHLGRTRSAEEQHEEERPAGFKRNVRKESRGGLGTAAAIRIFE
jgi:hypothetical protein